MSTARREGFRGLPTAKRLTRHKPHVSFEFFPPKTPPGWEKLKETATHLTEFNPDFVHLRRRSEHSRATCLAVKVMDVGVVRTSPASASPGKSSTATSSYQGCPTHLLLCDVLTRQQTANDVPIPEGGFRFAAELVSFVKKRGGFHILVSCYPEGHPEAASLSADVDNFMRKVEAGADAAVTQYFFNNAGYFHFVEEVRRRGVDIPIVVGLMPVWPYEQVARFSEKCGADLPLWIRKRMEGYQDPDSQFELAVEIAVSQS
jgi:methylenetetrahydrofolate reductase (NADPH)